MALAKEQVKEKARAAWHASGMKTISFQGYDMEYENHCFEAWWAQGPGLVDVESLQAQRELASEAALRIESYLVKAKPHFLETLNQLDNEDIKLVYGINGISYDRYEG